MFIAGNLGVEYNSAYFHVQSSHWCSCWWIYFLPPISAYLEF